EPPVRSEARPAPGSWRRLAEAARFRSPFSRSPTMEPNHERTPPEPARPAEPPAPRKRFRIQKLEERIAPKKQTGTYACSDSGGTYYSCGCGTTFDLQCYVGGSGPIG